MPIVPPNDASHPPIRPLAAPQHRASTRRASTRRTSTRRTLTSPSARRAFTLVEIMVVIGIIVLLVGISVFAFAQVARHSKAQKTKAGLEVCKALMAEYEATAGPAAKKSLTGDTTNSWNNAGNPVDSNPASTSYYYDDQTRWVMNELLKAPNAKQILARIPPDSLQYDLITTAPALGKIPLILDGYGKAIYYVPPAGLRNLIIAGQTRTNDSLQSDGQFHPITNLARMSAFWASSGPDGKVQEADDNQYSFEN